MTVAKYLRLSSEDNDLKSAGKPESNSIANQRDLLDTYIAQHKEFSQAQLVEFCDDGWSGKNFQRPGVQAMLEQVKAGKIQCILVKDLSRFARDYLTVGNYISKIFPFLGVRFIAVNDGLDSARPNDVDSLDTSFKTLLYDLYSRDLSRKVHSAKRFRAQRGDFIAPFAPYGYRKNPENHSRLVIDPPAAETVRRIFKLAAEGNSAVSVARLLNEDAVPTPMLYKRAAGCKRTRWPSVSENNFWTEHIVTRIVRNQQYLGKNIYGKRLRDTVGSTHTVKVSREDWITVEDAHEAIVSPDEFDRAQVGLRRFKAHDTPAKASAFAGKIRCGVCGHSLIRSKGKEKYFYCRTMQVMDSTACIEVHISEKDILAELQKNLRAYAEIAVDKEMLLAGQRELAQKEEKEATKKLVSVQSALERCKRESRQLYEAFALGDMDKAGYLAHKAVLTQKEQALSAQIESLQAIKAVQSTPHTDSFIDTFKPFSQPESISPDAIWELLAEVRVFPSGRLEVKWKYTDALEV